MKKLLICALALIPVSCMKVDLEQTFIYSKITVNETNSSYVSNKYKLGTYDEPYDYENDTVPEVINHEEMGVSFKAWLERDPKQKLSTATDWNKDYGLVMWYERNFYPSEEMIVNDLYSKGLLEAGEYEIDVNW